MPWQAGIALGTGRPVQRETGLRDSARTLWKGERKPTKQPVPEEQVHAKGRWQGGTSGELIFEGSPERQE